MYILTFVLLINTGTVDYKVIERPYSEIINTVEECDRIGLTWKKSIYVDLLNDPTLEPNATITGWTCKGI